MNIYKKIIFIKHKESRKSAQFVGCQYNYGIVPVDVIHILFIPTTYIIICNPLNPMV